MVDAGRPGVVSVPARGGRRTAGRLPGSSAPFGDRYQVAAGASGTWVARSGGVVIPLAAGTLRAYPPIRVGGVPTEIAAGRTTIWVVDLWRRRVVRIDPRRRTVLGAAHLAGRGSATGLQVTRDAVWVLETDGTLVRVDPATGRSVRRSRPVGGNTQTRALAAGGDRLWVASYYDRWLAEIDPATGRRLGPAVRLPIKPTHVAVGAGGVWAADQAGRVVRVDPARHRVVGRPLRVSRTPAITTGLAVSDGAVWLADGASGRLIRIEA